jgi:hypothetical protein
VEKISSKSARHDHYVASRLCPGTIELSPKMPTSKGSWDMASRYSTFKYTMYIWKENSELSPKFDSNMCVKSRLHCEICK